jgi:hypothetical protein
VIAASHSRAGDSDDRAEHDLRERKNESGK